MPALHLEPNSDRVTIFGQILKQLVAVHTYFGQRSERMAGIVASFQRSDLFEATVMWERKTYHVKLGFSSNGIVEYGREEDC